MRSNYSVDQTVERLKDILEAKQVSLFALVDHSGEAEKAGLATRPTKLLIFGSPKAGTPFDAGESQHRNRPAAQDSDLRGRRGESLGFVQQPGLLERAA